MSFFDRLLGRDKAPRSGSVARERLKLVLEYDRSQLTAAELEAIRDELIETLSHHVSIDRDEVVITLQRDGRLVAEIPLDRRRRRTVDRP
ncbi:MAG: cell division topological specificity factor MinE [Anaerolineae bacterium]|nr:cell division topological specificity factor MinE [Ardenticatenia bacterium]MBK8541395.1 cell division topological specificity factor MinE [Ardenticatenia bacterium]HQZ70905.1 cell division topological specificity factor MinE [Anaerolineae bacterium]HRA20330.1 cell division topological specificity factor MinE [Anaerolineae bacterium]